jgi:hypothetical protein
MRHLENQEPQWGRELTTKQTDDKIDDRHTNNDSNHPVDEDAEHRKDETTNDEGSDQQDHQKNDASYTAVISSTWRLGHEASLNEGQEYLYKKNN